MEFKLWRSTRGDEYCVITDPEIEDGFELDEGVPRLETMEGPVRCRMDSAFPKEVRLSDNLYGASVPIVSLRLRQMLESAGTKRIEFLPIELINHKGRKEPSEYFILHPLEMLECIDLDASGVEWNSIAPDQISRCRGLVLNHDAIPGDYKVFRPKFWGGNILIREDLVDKLIKADFSGLSFRPVDGYTGIG
jgi:hypothetical protein